MTAPQRWCPDPQMIEAVLAVPKSFVPMTQLPLQDRAWLVSGLTLAGLTADQIADRMQYPAGEGDSG